MGATGRVIPRRYRSNKEAGESLQGSRQARIWPDPHTTCAEDARSQLTGPWKEFTPSFAGQALCPRAGLHTPNGKGPCRGGWRLWVCVCARSCVCSHIQLLAMLSTAAHQGSSVHRIIQARIMDWGAILFSRGSSRPRDQTHISFISCVGSWILYHYTTQEARKGTCSHVKTHSTHQALLLPLLANKRELLLVHTKESCEGPPLRLCRGVRMISHGQWKIQRILFRKVT